MTGKFPWGKEEVVLGHMRNSAGMESSSMGEGKPLDSLEKHIRNNHADTVYIYK